MGQLFGYDSNLRGDNFTETPDAQEWQLFENQAEISALLFGELCRRVTIESRWGGGEIPQPTRDACAATEAPAGL